MWAVCTRFQADTDMDVIRNGMGAILDPSNRNGATAKLMIDATRKKQPYAKRHSFAGRRSGRWQERSLSGIRQAVSETQTCTNVRPRNEVSEVSTTRPGIPG